MYVGGWIDAREWHTLVGVAMFVVLLGSVCDMVAPAALRAPRTRRSATDALRSALTSTSLAC